MYQDLFDPSKLPTDQQHKLKLLLKSCFWNLDAEAEEKKPFCSNIVDLTLPEMR